LFCPPTQTLIKAINNGQLKGFPHMTADNVRKHLEPSPATTKGQLKMNKQGIRSTKPAQTPIPAPPQANHIFCFSAMANKTKRTLYHDLTGRLPVMSLEGNQYIKNHFISGLCTTDSNFPLQLRDQLAVQAQATLNLLQTSHHDPSKSAYEALNGAYEFNKWPMAPPGTKAIIWENPSGRQSWAPQGIDAWYVGPSKDHYRLYQFYFPDTQVYSVDGSVEFFPQHCKLPTLSKTKHAKAVAT
jgi:hypothetical protein